MKCDEEKPACARCTTTGRKCDGYAPVKKNKKRTPSSTPAFGSSSVIVQRNPSPECLGTPAGRRSFHFFCIRTAPQLAGYFVSEFWERLIPLSTHQQPAIRHAVLALAALHERFENSDDSILSSNLDLVHGGFALQQYNRAIGYLIKPIAGAESQALDIYLVACILFACFEVRHPIHGI